MSDLDIATPLPPDELTGDGGSHSRGIVVHGALRPFVYIYEIETGVWHWMGRYVEDADGATRWQGEDSGLYVSRSKCSRYFRHADDDTVLMYAATTPKSEQYLCLECNFPPEEKPPTLYRGDDKVGTLLP